MIKRNSNPLVVNYNKDLILPKVSTENWIKSIRSISFTKEELKKLSFLQKKYKLSRSAIVRILLDNIEE